MTPNTPALVYFVAGVFLLLVIRSLVRRRDAIAQRLRYGFMVIACFFVAILVARQFTTDGTKVGLFALLVEVVAASYFRPARQSRHIPRSERRKVIEHYERRGKRFDPKRHHIDHIVPYARGGSNRADNLRVLEKETNLAKSDRSPWWDVFG